MVIKVWPRTSQSHRAILRREQSSYDFTETSRLRFETGPEAEQLKRTHSDPHIHKASSDHGDTLPSSCSQQLILDHTTRWPFIRQQPEYKRLMRDIALKRAFEEQGQGRQVQMREQASQTVSSPLLNHTRKSGKSSREGSAQKRLEKRQEKPGAMEARNRCESVKSQKSDRPSHQVTEASSRRGSRKVSCETSTDITELDLRSSSDRQSKRGHGSGNGRKQHTFSNVTLPGRSGIGQISLQMSDIHRPGITKTMSMNYSSSALFQNSRILSEELIRVSGRKDAMRQAFVRRTERRIKLLQKNREQRLQTKAELEKMKRMEEENDLETAYFRRPEATLLAQSASDYSYLGTGDKKDFRKERIKERTMLLPENYKTSNYLKDFNVHQYKTVGNASYIRGSQNDET